MEKNTKILYAIVGLLVLACIGIGFSLKSSESLGASVGGAKYIPYKYNFTKGFQVAGVDIITSDDLNIAGNAVFDDSNTTTTISLGDTGRGKVCLWNGENYTTLVFFGNTTTPTYATSTACN